MNKDNISEFVPDSVFIECYLEQPNGLKIEMCGFS